VRRLVNVLLDRVAGFDMVFFVAAFLHHAVHRFADSFHRIGEPGFFRRLLVLKGIRFRLRPENRGGRRSCFLLHMRQPGVEVRPLKQITGHSLFSEVFMTNARAEKKDLIGRLNQGWEIAQTTLGYERGANSLGRVTRYAVAFSQLVRATGEEAFEMVVPAMKIRHFHFSEVTKF